MKFPARIVIVVGFLLLVILGAVTGYVGIRWFRRHRAEPQRVEIVSINEEKQTLTARDVRTGETFSVGFGNATHGIAVLTDGAAAGAIPAWVPRYPGGSPENCYAVSATDSMTGAYHFKTANKPAAVIAFFEKQLKIAGMTATSSPGSVVAEGLGGKHRVTVSVTGGAETRATVTYVERN